jgi:hypothetical protein
MRNQPLAVYRLFGTDHRPWTVLPAVGAAVLFGALLWTFPPVEAAAQLHPACAKHDQLAVSLIKPLLDDESETGLHQLNDAVRSLIVARRRCHVGWMNLADRNYLYLIDRLRASQERPAPPP